MTTSSTPSAARRTSRRMPSSRIDTTGISGSGTVSSTAQARSSAGSAAVVRLAVEVIVMLRGLPARAGGVPREALHLGEHIAHVFRVLAMLAGRDVLHRFWQRERGFVERGVHVFLPAGLQI